MADDNGQHQEEEKKPSVKNGQILDVRDLDKDFNYFLWIENEGLLRDEGVICGISGVDASHKIAAIESYYQEKAAFFSNRKIQIDKRLISLQTECETENASLLEIAEKIIAQEKLLTGNESSGMIRAAFGLVLVTMGCAFTYVIVYETIRSYTDYPWLTAFGIFFVGMFSMFAGVSYFFTTDADHRHQDYWKLILLEMGLPFVAALYAVHNLFQAGKVVAGIISFLFLFMSFLLVGKLMLSLLQGFQKSLDNARELKTTKANATDVLTRLAESETTLKDKLKLLKNLQIKFKEDLFHLPSDESLESHKLARIRIFLSEYHLAKTFSTSKSGLQMDLLNNINHG